MDDELKQHLVAMEGRLDAKIEQLDAKIERLDAKIEHVEARLDAKIERLETRLDAKIEHVETRLDAKIEHVETALLTEFHKWASPVESRMRTHRSWFYEVDAEVELLKNRVQKLEGGTPSA
jgi:chaperonin cofactor prefoldin